MSETNGRCRRQLEESYADNFNCVPRYAWITADAIDRLAADVAAVKEATLPQTTEERDCAIRERDEARAEVGRLLGELAEAKADSFAREDNGKFIPSEREWNELVDRKNAAVRERDEAKADAERLYAALAARPAAAGASDEIAALQLLVNKYRNKAEAYGGMVRGCSPALERAGHPVDGRGPDGAVGGVARAVEALVRERDDVRAEVERLRAELAARPAAGLTADDCWQLRVAAEHLKRLGSDACVKTIEGLLARAGSPPVVEVPALGPPDSMTIRESAIHSLYRAAIDRAGIAWKAVPRE